MNTTNTISWTLFSTLLVLAIAFFYVYSEGLRRISRKFGLHERQPLFNLLAVPMGLALWGIVALLLIVEELTRPIGFQLWPYIPLSIGLAIFSTYVIQVLLLET